MKRDASNMHDVAALARVSLGTVSNVLNHPNKVAEQTRVRVQHAIDKLGWVRNESARQLRAGQSRSIGLVVMDIKNPFFADLAEGVEEAAAAAGYSVLLANSAHQQERESVHLELLNEHRIGGVILAPTGATYSTNSLERVGTPVVLVDRVERRSGRCSVSVDDFLGGELAARHLLDQGHTRLAVVGGNSVIQQVNERRDGAGRAVEQTTDATLLTISTDTLDVEAGRVVAEAIWAMADQERPTGVFAANDLVALGLLQGLVARGLRVPADVAIIGYDDIEFAAAAAVPLSSVAQPRVELGRRAAELLLDEIQALEIGAPLHNHENVVFTPELRIRQSSSLSIQNRRPIKRPA